MKEGTELDYCVDESELLYCYVTVEDRSYRTGAGIAIFNTSYSSYHSEIRELFPTSIANKQGGDQDRNFTNVSAWLCLHLLEIREQEFTCAEN